MMNVLRNDYSPTTRYPTLTLPHPTSPYPGLSSRILKGRCTLTRGVIHRPPENNYITRDAISPSLDLYLAISRHLSIYLSPSLDLSLAISRALSNALSHFNAAAADNEFQLFKMKITAITL